MNSNLILIPKKDMSRAEWLDARKDSLGGSDISALLAMNTSDGEVRVGFNPYKSATKLYYEKVGLWDSPQEESLPMFMGSYLEDKVADLWQYYGAEPEDLISNYNAGLVQRKARQCNFIIINPKYGWLSANVDRLINTEFTPSKKDNGVLEIKVMDKMAVGMWENEVPQNHIIQLQTYLLITELNYGELCILKSGRELVSFPITRSDVICEEIIKQSEAFWSRIVKGRELFAEMTIAQQKGLYAQAERLESAIDELAPSGESSPAHIEFLKEKYKKGLTDYERLMTLEEVGWAKKHKQAKERINEWEQVERLYKSYLMTAMKDYERIAEDGSKNRVDWTMTKAGNRVFNNRFKLD